MFVDEGIRRMWGGPSLHSKVCHMLDYEDSSKVIPWGNGSVFHNEEVNFTKLDGCLIRSGCPLCCGMGLTQDRWAEPRVADRPEKRIGHGYGKA
jgi:hypothetical protein